VSRRGAVLGNRCPFQLADPDVAEIVVDETLDRPALERDVRGRERARERRDDRELDRDPGDLPSQLMSFRDPGRAQTRIDQRSPLTMPSTLRTDCPCRARTNRRIRESLRAGGLLAGDQEVPPAKA
jgi:hypothetical protein